MNSDLDELEAQFGKSELWARTGLVVFNLLMELKKRKESNHFVGTFVVLNHLRECSCVI